MALERYEPGNQGHGKVLDSVSRMRHGGSTLAPDTFRNLALKDYLGGGTYAKSADSGNLT